MSDLISLLEFHIALSEIMLTACTDHLRYNLSLIKSCSVCPKQQMNAAVNDVCSLVAKWTWSDLVAQRASSLIINFEQVIKSFLVWNIHFNFFLPLVDCAFLL